VSATDDDGLLSLWPTLFLKRQIPGSEQANIALSAWILQLAEQNDQLTTDYQLQNLFETDHPSIQWLRQCTNKTVIDYLKAQSINYDVDWRVQAWANINRKGDYHSLHNHPRSYLSGTYYVEVPEQPDLEDRRNDINPASISFFDPRPQVNMTAIAGDSQIDPEYRVLPKAGLMLLWPSFLHHAVHPNLADAPRISVSFNILLKWRDAYLPS